MKHPEHTSRRSFLNRLWALLGGLAFLQFAWIGISTFKSSRTRGREKTLDDIIIAGRMEDFSPKTITAIPQGQFYLACLEDGSFLAISRTCTHLGCSIPWDAKQGKFVCPCHGSTFSPTGEVLSAPAPRPLDIYPVRIENRIIKVNISRPLTRERFEPSQATRVA